MELAIKLFVCFIIIFISFFFGAFFEWRSNRKIIEEALKDAAEALEEALKDAAEALEEAIKAKLELQKYKDNKIHQATHAACHNLFSNVNEKSELVDKVKRYEKYAPKTEIYKKTIIEWHKAWKTSEWIWKQLNMSGSAIRKALRSWSV